MLPEAWPEFDGILNNARIPILCNFTEYGLQRHSDMDFVYGYISYLGCDSRTVIKLDDSKDKGGKIGEVARGVSDDAKG